MKNKIIIAATAAVVLLSSCATSFGVQKRKYTKGYHVSVTHKNNTINKHEQENKQVVVKQQEAVVIAPAPPVKAITNTVGFTKTASTVNAEKQTSPKREAKILTASTKQKHNAEVVKHTFKSVTLAKHIAKSNTTDDAMLIVEIILCLFPFINLIAIYLHDSKAITLNFWVTLILDILFFLPGIIFALLVVLDVVNLDK